MKNQREKSVEKEEKYNFHIFGKKKEKKELHHFFQKAPNPNFPPKIAPK